MDLDIINPLLDEIRQMYPKLFKAIRKSVSVIEDKELLEVPDDEIAYLATHIGAVIHKQNQSTVKKYSAIVACLYGIGASQLLLAQLKKNFPNIHIAEVVGIIDDELADLKKDEVDLLITTVPIDNTTLPTVLINPILKDEDIFKINDLLSQLIPKKHLFKQHRYDNFKEKLVALKEYLRIITKLFENYSYIELEHQSNMMSLINYISDDIAGNQEERNVLEKAFAFREEKGSTILSKKGMVLLHCRADIKKELSLQIIQMKQPMFMTQENGKIPVDTFVVMVAPVVLNQKILNVLSEISRNIISEDLMDIIKQKDPKSIENELSNILEKFYQKLVYNPE